MGKKIVDIELVDAEKRRVPSKHYVYVIVVRWSDGSCFKIYRRYSRFFDLQTVLLDSFPIEGGSLDPSKRMIPFLPGKIFFGRSHVKDVAMKRLTEINNYCQSLIALPPRISQCDHVLEFFEVEPDDLDPPSTEKTESKKSASKEEKAEKISKPKRLECFVAVAGYEPQAPGELSLQPGTKVEVLEKNDIGWWFVNSEDEQGWVPSTFLEPEEGTAATEVRKALPGEEEMFVCIEDFRASSEDEVSLEKGVAVSVIQKNMDGWWLIRYQGKEAFAPGTYLKKANNASRVSMMEKSRLSGVEIVSSLQDVSTLLNSDKKPQEKNKPQISVPALEKTAFASAFVKQRSLERGGSLKPPPRQNSIKKMEVPKIIPKTGIYVTIADFDDTVGDGISFHEGQKVLVLEKTSTGWWLVRLGQQEGWVPASYLESCTGNLDTNSVYELANSQETSNFDEGGDSDSDQGDWYTEPDNDPVEEIGSKPPAKVQKRPLPEVPVDEDDYEPVEEVKKAITRPFPPIPPSGDGNVPLAKKESKPQLPPSNNMRKDFPSTMSKVDKVESGPADLASVLKAKFEARSGAGDGNNSFHEDKDAKSPKPALPTPPLKPSEVGKQHGMKEKPLLPQLPNKIDQGKSKLFEKPALPFKSKSPNVGQSQEKEIKTDQNKTNNLAKPAPPSKLKSPVMFQNQEKKSESSLSSSKSGLLKFPLKPPPDDGTKGSKDAVVGEKNDVKNLAAVFNASRNPTSSGSAAVKATVAPKPNVPCKPKPSVSSKPSMAAKPKPAIQPKSSSNISSIASSLNNKLNFNNSAIRESSVSNHAGTDESCNAGPKRINIGSSNNTSSNAASKVSQKTKTFVALYDFVGEADGEVSFNEGDSVEVLEENGDWIFIQLWDEEGWAPAAYFQEM